MNQNQFTPIGAFCVLLMTLSPLYLVNMICHFSFGAASKEDVDSLYDHGGGWLFD